MFLFDTKTVPDIIIIAKDKISHAGNSGIEDDGLRVGKNVFSVIVAVCVLLQSPIYLKMSLFEGG